MQINSVSSAVNFQSLLGQPIFQNRARTKFFQIITNKYILFIIITTILASCSPTKEVLNKVNQRFPSNPGKAEKVTKGIHHYTWLGRDTILKRNASINVIDIDLQKAAVKFDFAWFNGDDKLRNVVSFVADTAGAIVAANSGYFEILENNTFVSFHKSNGVINQRVNIPTDHVRYWKHQAAFVQTGAKSFAFIQGTQDLYEKLPLDNIISSAPLLISDGIPVGKHFVKQKTGDKSKMDGENPERHQGGLGPRMAYATTADNHLILMAIDGRSTKAEGINAEELTDLLYQYFNATNAINMDGGGSITMFVRGATPTGVVNYPSDNRKNDPNRFDHTGQRKVGMALLVIPNNEKTRRKMQRIKVASDTDAKDYIDIPKQ